MFCAFLSWSKGWHCTLLALGLWRGVVGGGLEFVSAVFAVNSIGRVLCLAVSAEAGRGPSRDCEGLTGSRVQVELVPAFALEP